MGINLLDIKEENFWKCTPRKLIALWKTYKHVNGLNDNNGANTNENKVGYIDDIVF